MPQRPAIHRARGHRPADAARGTRTQRGYDNAWLRTSKAFLREHPTCADCEAEGIVTPATQVHHRAKVQQRPDLKHDWANLLALCRPCHSRRTQRGE